MFKNFFLTSVLFLIATAASAAVTTILVTGDTYTDSSDVVNHCSEQTMYVTGESAFYINSWLYASLTALPSGVQIDSAKLYVYPQFILASSTIDSKTPSGAWAECTITHSNRPTTSYGVPYEDWNEVSAYQWYWWNVTAITQEWYSGLKTNYGIRLVPDNITVEPQVKFYTSNYTDPLKRPYFEVTYTDIQNPVATITSPTSNPTYPTSSSSINIGGSASDNVGVAQVLWSNDRGGSGTATGTTSWSVTGITLFSGDNVITITAKDAANNPGTDTLTVTYTLPSTINRSPATMNFSGQQDGANPANQTLSIYNSGGGALNWSVSDDAAWLSLDPTSGSSTGETDSVTVSVNTTGLSAGEYNGTITILATGATNTPQTVSVALTVTPIGCSCGNWSNISCGGDGCSSSQMNQTRSCTPAGSCVGVSQSQCLDDSGGLWVDQGCGAGSCSATQMYQTRSCTYGCLPISQCVIHVSCSGSQPPIAVIKVGDNLFNPRTGGTSKVRFNVPSAGRVSLKIYNLSGRLVRTLFEGDSNSGDMQKDWNGKDDDGRYVVPSVYFLHYVYPGGKEVRKIGVKK